jgi:hypothetical protein
MESGKGIVIRKASGETESFDASKLEQSLKKAGASQSFTERIIHEILNTIQEGASTRQIYRQAYKLLNQFNRTNALKYSLKQALLDMGETGYPFEHLVGEIFRRQGYAVQVGQIIHGQCITHEIDVIATNSKEQILVECKYSSNQGKHVGVQVPLYVHSRVEDIVMKRKHIPEFVNLSFSAYVVTNTRFSEDSLEYAKCNGMILIGWDFPQGKGLKDMIEKYQIFPITILKQLTNKEKQTLMQKGIVTCSQLVNNKHNVEELGVSEKRKKKILQELDNLR